MAIKQLPQFWLCRRKFSFAFNVFLVLLLVFGYSCTPVNAQYKRMKHSFYADHSFKSFVELGLEANRCPTHATCGECINANPLCSWCVLPGNFSQNRCDTAYKLQEYGCPSIYHYTPTSTKSIIQDDELSNKTEYSDSIQIRPQRIELRLRPNIPQNFTLQFTQALDYPVDLYYLMDLSKSMKDDKAKIAELGRIGSNTSAIELKDNATENVKIEYTSKCLGDKKDQTNICKGLRVGDTVEFELTVTVTSCPRNPAEMNQTIKVYPVGLDDALYIDLIMICGCDCEKEWNRVEFSPECGNKGTYQCGICGCHDNYYGRRCECHRKDSNPGEEENSCLRGNDTKVCSGRGICRCGECECYKRHAPDDVTGRFCECDNFSCDRFDGKFCAGPDHGTCVCGNCECKDGWTGLDCSCKVSKDECLNPKTGKECSGNGKCVCGQCVCDETEKGQYTGQFCDICQECRKLCDTYKDCVQCRIHETGPLSKEECNNCPINPISTSEFEVLEGEELCVFWDENDCRFSFKHRYDSVLDVVFVIAQNSKECPEPVDVLAIVFGVIVGIVLIGLALLLIWKLRATIKDRREVTKFYEEKMNAMELIPFSREQPRH